MQVNPSRSRACKPLPRPQKGSTIFEFFGHVSAPNWESLRRNFSISCSGVSKRIYASSQERAQQTFELARTSIVPVPPDSLTELACDFTDYVLARLSLGPLPS